ncbi:uncharacterized protein PG986_007052 [Apiospora aurea]|uniref:Uncharacterized protein n=1 Tax=Apiospora aurea TaxID=335848 RepID=A0ABR1QBG4_9PEZI
MPSTTTTTTVRAYVNPADTMCFGKKPAKTYYYHSEAEGMDIVVAMQLNRHNTPITRAKQAVWWDSGKVYLILFFTSCLLYFLAANERQMGSASDSVVIGGA